MIRNLLQYLYQRQRLLCTLMIIATAFILMLTLLPNEKLTKSGLFRYDKIGHALVFGGWTFLFGLVRLSYKQLAPSYLGMEVLAGIGFGLSIELLQLILPINRSANFYDFLADLIGVLLAVYFLRITHRELEEERAVTSS